MACRVPAESGLINEKREVEGVRCMRNSMRHTNFDADWQFCSAWVFIGLESSTLPESW